MNSSPWTSRLHRCPGHFFYAPAIKSNRQNLHSKSMLLSAVMSSSNVNYAVAAAAVVSAAAITVAYRDYRTYLSFGPHGLPDTFWGWYTQLKLRRLARNDVMGPPPYDLDEVLKDSGAHATSGFLSKSLQPREGSRPTVPGFAAPQRQTTAIASETMKKRMFAFLDDLVRANEATLQSELSVLEGPVPALQLRAGVDKPEWLKRTRGEMVHVHPPDGSTHLMLSLADSQRVIEQGWGLRHKLSGTIVPWNYTLMYAPRNETEFATWKGVVQAAVSYCCYGVAEIQMLKTDLGKP